ncbi:hypothetical protein OG897_16960 [Streptomyces sp. NBC_00237]|uniref:hypothetical protein n=1 Tax=Streptomyces sp. NBC_00237 TaxID=2975687 RepID=UPI002258657A|nr:hypothetical protein [Streptomyces sp. NBC_00237]MCX5203132.1 hypothetical protein [Streptomyces sp. NBC_00237]
MELWDQQVEPYAQNLEGLEAVSLSNLSLDAIETTIPLIGPPFGEFFPPSHAALIELALELRRNNPTGWHSDSASAARFLARYDELPDVPVRPAVGPFFMALVRLFEGSGDALSPDDAMEILSSCYESVLMSHLAGNVTLDDERNSHQCVSAINEQIQLIKGCLVR